jgi:cytoskeletal protein RodZ
MFLSYPAFNLRLLSHFSSPYRCIHEIRGGASIWNLGGKTEKKKKKKKFGGKKKKIKKKNKKMGKTQWHIAPPLHWIFIYWLGFAGNSLAN